MFEFVFPDAEDAPLGGAEGEVHALVAGDVGGEFIFPKGTVPFRLGPMDRAAMPEAAVDEHRHPRFCEDKIGADGEGQLRGLS